MRIGLLTDGYKPGVNGIIRFISLHKRALETMGHEIFVFTWGRQDPDDEVGVIRSPGLPFVKPGYHVSLGHSRQARSILRTLDLLHANQPLLSGALALRYGKRYRLPVVFTAHSRYDLLSATRLPLIPPPACRAIIRPYLRWFADRCDLVTAPTPEAAQVMRSLGVNCPIEIVPYGVDLAHYRESPGRSIHGDLALPASVPLALYVGRLALEKNVRFLLQALTQPELAHACLLIVGDGAERNHLRAYASEMGLDGRVRFVGEVPPADVLAYISLADFFVTASRVEMMPIAVLEALASELPIVALDVPWSRRVVQHGVNGLLAAQDVVSFARTWAVLLEDEALLIRLAEGARTTAEEYDVQRTTALMVDHYQRVVEKRNRLERQGA